MFGLAVSPSGAVVALLGSGPEANRLTVAERNRAGTWPSQQFDVALPEPRIQPVFSGLAFDGEKAAYISEGAAGTVTRQEWNTGRSRALNLNQKGYTGSVAGDLAFDPARGILYIADQVNSRVVVMDTKSRQVLASIPARRPYAMALTVDRQTLYVIDRQESTASNSVHVVNVIVPTAPQLETSIPVNAASGIAISPTHLFVSNALDDSILAVDLANRSTAEIPIRIPGLETLRGVQPMGLAIHAASGRLLVAESGINAVGIVDMASRRVLGHVPAAWMPSRVAVHEDTVFVATSRGHGTGAHTGSFAVFALPTPAELEAHTAIVMEANGFRPRPAPPRPLPDGVKHVVMIVKGNRTYDELMGDVERASNGPAMGDPTLARFGASGFANGRGVRLSIKGANIAPNHRSIARRWSFGDNFYADGMPDLVAVREHVTGHGASFLEFPAGETSVTDQARASQFIREIDTKYVQTAADLPQLIVIHLPNDGMADARPADGYPYEESFVGDNDYALGRIVEFLSGTRWWQEMAVLITESAADGGLDHLDERRTVVYCAGPWAKRDYVVHANTGFPGLWKTVFRFLKLPPMNLLDAAATDLSDAFTAQPDFAPYKVVPVDPRIFDPAR